jgi:hypothetical protein
MAYSEQMESLWARIQAFMGEFLMTDQQLLDARRNLETLRGQSLSTGSVKTAKGAVYTTAQIDALLDENMRLVENGQALKGQLSELASQYQAIKNTASDIIETGADFYGQEGGVPGLLGPEAGIGIAPAIVSVAVWIGAAGILYFGISRFLSSVKDHLNKAAGGAADILMYAGVAALGLAAWFLFGRKT